MLVSSQTIFSYLLYISIFTAPTATPTNITVDVINSSSVSISWSKPNKSVLHGILRRYDLEYRRIECNESDPVTVQINSWVQKQVGSASSSLVINGLVFWSCYELRVRAVTVGEGPFSAMQLVRTKEHCESIVRTFLCRQDVYPHNAYRNKCYCLLVFKYGDEKRFLRVAMTYQRTQLNILLKKDSLIFLLNDVCDGKNGRHC